MPEILRRDFHVTTRDDVRVAIREVRPDGPAPGVPIVLLHGTRIPGLSEFDLPVPNGSLAADLAAEGHVAWILDARGYGRSERPAEMEAPPVPGARSLCRSIEITRDVEAAVDHLLEATGQAKAALLGWGVGGTIVAMYAALAPEKVSHVIGYAMVYGGVAGHPFFTIGSKWDDPARPGTFNRAAFGNYTWNGLELLDAHWNGMIPVADKDDWRDPAMFAAFRQALIDGDPRSGETDPPRYRSPNGMLEDLFTMMQGHTLFSASQIYCKVMIARGEYDELCREADMAAFIAELTNAEDVVYFNRRNATQYLILDRPDHGRTEFLSALDGFLT